MWFRTESGSMYEVDRHGGRIRRVNEGYSKRGDGEWQRFFAISPWPIIVGHGVVITQESLAEHGPDDAGQVVPGSTATVRTTTRVVEVWG